MVCSSNDVNLLAGKAKSNFFVYLKSKKKGANHLFAKGMVLVGGPTPFPEIWSWIFGWGCSNGFSFPLFM